MPLVKCPHCRQPVTLQPEHAGVQVQCPACRRGFLAKKRVHQHEPQPNIEFPEIPEHPRPHPVAVLFWFLTAGVAASVLAILVFLLVSALAEDPEQLPAFTRQRLFIVGAALFVAMIPLYVLAWAIDRMSR